MSWKTRGKCAQDEQLLISISRDPINNDIFFSKNLIPKGKAYCADCPVKDLCFIEGLRPIPSVGLPPGIWGGQSERERRRHLRNLDKRLSMLQEQMQTLLRDDGFPNVS